MTDETKFTQADIDRAVQAAVANVQNSIDKLEAKNEELVGEVRKYKAEARKAGDIKPEDLQAAEDARDKALADLAEANKQVKALTGERDKAVKALESEQGAARSYALEAEIASAIASGNVLPALVPAFKAMVMQNAKADLVDGKYAVTIGDKPAKDYVSGFLESDDGKAFKSAPVNTGSGAQGGGAPAGGKTATRTAFDAMSPAEKVEFGKAGGIVTDKAA